MAKRVNTITCRSTSCQFSNTKLTKLALVWCGRSLASPNAYLHLVPPPVMRDEPTQAPRCASLPALYHNCSLPLATL